MSAFGTKRRPAMSAVGGKADIALIFDNVCFLTQSGHLLIQQELKVFVSPSA
jgi:hypothetical protein